MILARHVYDVADFIKLQSMGDTTFAWQHYLVLSSSKKIVCPAYSVNKKWMIATRTCIDRMKKNNPELKGLLLHTMAIL